MKERFDWERFRWLSERRPSEIYDKDKDHALLDLHERVKALESRAPCKTCGGRGMMVDRIDRETTDDMIFPYVVYRKCPDCNGTGRAG
jgi:hypothetical protein